MKVDCQTFARAFIKLSSLPPVAFLGIGDPACIAFDRSWSSLQTHPLSARDQMVERLGARVAQAIVPPGCVAQDWGSLGPRIVFATFCGEGCFRRVDWY